MMVDHKIDNLIPSKAPGLSSALSTLIENSPIIALFSFHDDHGINNNVDSRPLPSSFIVLISILHDDVLVEGSTAVAWWLWPLLLLLMALVMMVVGADDDNGLAIVTLVCYVDVVRCSDDDNGLTIVTVVLRQTLSDPLACTNRKHRRSWDRRKLH
jgi:hypothetical protein